MICPLPQPVPASPLARPRLPVSLPEPIPLVFGPAERPLFGWHHPASPGRARGTAVVLCNPIGHEALWTHATYRYLAEQLAAAGYPALRFDYDGTGDSFGSDEDEGRVESWLTSIGFAMDTLRERSGTTSIALFGVRLGATLAAVAAAKRGDVSHLLLWAACKSGRSYLRETRALRAAHSQGSSTAPPCIGQEYEEAAGFLITKAAADALNALDPASLTGRPAAHALLLGRDDLPNDSRLGERLTALGTAVTQAQPPGYAAMMRDAQDTEIPQTAIQEIIDWLGSHSAASAGRTASSVPRNAAASPPLAAEAYTEEAIFTGAGPRSFGILTRPRAGCTRANTAVLLLNVGANHHIGPNRMSVTLARQLAALGFPTLRLDTPGAGDSAEGAASARQQIYSQSAIPHVQAALSHLETRLGVTRFILIGLCSGAYRAYRAAAGDPRVSTQVLINPQTFEWNEGETLEMWMRRSYKPTQVYLTSVKNKETWKRALSGQVDMKGIANVLGKRLTERSAIALKSTATLALQRKRFETPVRQTFRQLADRGTDTLFLFSAGDAGLEVTASYLGTSASAIGRQKNIEMAVFEDADHTFTQKAARDQMLSRIVQHLLQRYPDCGH